MACSGSHTNRIREFQSKIWTAVPLSRTYPPSLSLIHCFSFLPNGLIHPFACRGNVCFVCSYRVLSGPTLEHTQFCIGPHLLGKQNDWLLTNLREKRATNCSLMEKVKAKGERSKAEVSEKASEKCSLANSQRPLSHSLTFRRPFLVSKGQRKWQKATRKRRRRRENN